MQETKGYKIEDKYGMYFVTFTVVGWVDLFTRKECVDIVLRSMKYCQENKGLRIHAYVIMPSHIHLIVSAAEDSDGLSAIIRDYKKYTSKALLDWILNDPRESRSDWLQVVFRYHAKTNANNKHYQIWKQNNQPKQLLHPRFINQKLNYIHVNPVVSGLVKNEEDYRYSSAHSYMTKEEGIVQVEYIDFGVEEGYIMT